MTTDAKDRSTWPRNDRVIRRDELLRLIEENGGPQGLDLRGAIFVGEGPGDDPLDNPIDLRAEALVPLVMAYRQTNGDSYPPWLGPVAGISLSRAQLQKAHLTGAQLHGASLWAAQLEGADLTGADLWGAQLQEAGLTGAQLRGAQLPYAQLEGADLTGAQLQGARLLDGQLRGADLTGAQLHGVDMYHVRSLDGARWYGAHLDHTRIRRASLGKAIGDELEAHKSKTADGYYFAMEAYLLLKNNFNQIGRYEDASWAYVKEQQMEKMAYYWEWHFWGWRVWRARGFFWRSFGRWLRNWAYELATGYGERPWNAVRAGLVAILAFAAGFWACGITGGRGAVAFLDCLVYSIATFATFNLARPNLNPTGRGIEIASSLEAILGIAVLALVVFTVGNRMSRS